MSIWVGVRVRPFNQRQKSLNSQRCVVIKDNLVRLELPGAQEKAHEFEFDGCFWSHDGFKINDQGYYEPINEEFTDQKKIFDVIGTKMLSLSFEDIDTSFIAYGQTGAGKTYSTFGLPENVGIVQNFGKELLKQIQDRKSEKLKYSVMMSVFEIYMEELEDLFVSWKQKKEKVQIKQNKEKGIHLQNLSVRPVFNFQDIHKNIQEACKNKNIATTVMSRLSSRGHTFVYFYLTKTESVDENETKKVTLIQFVDLAGSERICKTGVIPSILKEVKEVNKSMLAFKNVVEALSAQSDSEKKGFICYRDSKLTRLLQESLSRATKTFVMCPISPSYDSYDQTLLTLRMGSLIKRIKKCSANSEIKTEKPYKPEQLFQSKKVEQE